MIFKFASVLFAHGPAAGRLARLMNRLAASRDQIMPVAQRFASGAQTIGAGRGQPIKPGEIPRVQLHAIVDQLHPVLIIGATAVPAVEKLAGDVRRIENARLLVFQFVDAAATTAVAQRLPLTAIERGERALPEWHLVVHFTASL